MQASQVLTVDDQFYLDGKPFRILSGAIHYFRVHPACWRDRLAKLRACGFNTVETYVPWNLHEPEEGQYNFSGFANITKFIALAKEIGLKVIIRPGPYICAEWENGGLPAWLEQVPGIRPRCHNKPFLQRVRRWYAQLLPRLAPFLCTKGGPIIAMQVENEYGSFGNDAAYLRYLETIMRDLGMDCLLFTSDGWQEYMLRGGTLPHLLKTVNFGSRPLEAFAALHQHQSNRPPMCMEFWCGWFDHWGEAHHTRDAGDVALTLDSMLGVGASVNMYMFHGGTNFGFCNGANFDAERQLYQPTTTSYDYDALLDEAGNVTEKYRACQKVLTKYFGEPPEMEIHHNPAIGYGKVDLEYGVSLWDALPEISEPAKCAHPLSMEELGGQYGYILYRTTLRGPVAHERLRMPSMRDRATVCLDGEVIGTLYRNEPDAELYIDVPEGETARLDILVENMGRVNYGTQTELPKGISGHVLLGRQVHFDWTMYLLPMQSLPEKMRWNERVQTPCFLKGHLDIQEVADTYLDMSGFGKGVVFVNRFNLGRYWSEGPQKRLYIPAPLLKAGRNELMIFETDAFEARSVQCMDAPAFIKAKE